MPVNARHKRGICAFVPFVRVLHIAQAFTSRLQKLAKVRFPKCQSCLVSSRASDPRLNAAPFECVLSEVQIPVL